MAITDTVPVPAGINTNVKAARQATMLGLLGNPRSAYDQQCRDITDPTLAALIEVRDLGPIRARGLRPAVRSLAAIIDEIATQEPDVHTALGTAGMLCVRLVRGSTTAISNHSWGTAIDLTLDGITDTRGDGRVKRGLAVIAPIFNRHGWYWGAGFGTEDAMHFECGDALIRAWHAAGEFGGTRSEVPDLLSLGDRGPDVTALQRLLNRHGGGLATDGVFGTATHAALVAFQVARALAPTGTADAATRAAMGS